METSSQRVAAAFTDAGAGRATIARPLTLAGRPERAPAPHRDRRIAAAARRLIARLNDWAVVAERAVLVGFDGAPAAALGLVGAGSGPVRACTPLSSSVRASCSISFETT
jgi:hypothetical protein